MDNASQIVACAEESVVLANAPTQSRQRSIEHEDGYWMTILLHRRRREKLYASIYRNFPATRLRATPRNSPPADAMR